MERAGQSRGWPKVGASAPLSTSMGFEEVIRCSQKMSELVTNLDWRGRAVAQAFLSRRLRAKVKARSLIPLPNAGVVCTHGSPASAAEGSSLNLGGDQGVCSGCSSPCDKAGAAPRPVTLDPDLNTESTIIL